MIPSALVRVLCGATLGTVLVTAPAALANDEHERDPREKHGAAPRTSVQGTVEAVSPRSITLEGSDGSSVQVALDQDTQYDNGGKTGSVTDLRPGMTVSVHGEKQKDGTLRANAVRYGQPGTSALHV